MVRAASATTRARSAVPGVDSAASIARSRTSASHATATRARSAGSGMDRIASAARRAAWSAWSGVTSSASCRVVLPGSCRAGVTAPVQSCPGFVGGCCAEPIRGVERALQRNTRDRDHPKHPAQQAGRVVGMVGCHVVGLLSCRAAWIGPRGCHGSGPVLPRFRWGVLRRVYTRRIKYVATQHPRPQHPETPRTDGGPMTVTDERIPAQWARGAVLLGAATTRETQTANGEMTQAKAVTPIVAPDVAPVVTPTIAEPVTPTVTPAVADSAGDVAESVTPERDAEPRNAEPQKPVLRGLGAIIYARAQAREMRRNGRAERRNRARITRAEAKAIRCAGSAGTATRGGILGWLRDLPTHTLGIGVTVGWLMALAGSAVGQLAWWSSEFPWWIACLFALTF